MAEAHDQARPVTNAPQIRQRRSLQRWGYVMLLSFIISLVSSKPAYVWKPAVTLTDPRIVSELAGSGN